MLFLHYVPGLGAAKRENIRRPERIRIGRVERIGDLIHSEGKFWHRLPNGMLLPHALPAGGTAPAYTGSPDLDFESAAHGFDGTLVELGTSLAVDTTSVLNGTYGLHSTNDGSNDDSRGHWLFTALAEVYAVCLYKIVTTVGIAAHQHHFALNATTGGAGYKSMFSPRSQASYTHRAHLYDGAGFNASSPDLQMAADTLYGVSIHYKQGTGANSEHHLDVTVDGSAWTNYVTKTNGAQTTTVAALQLGTDGAAIASETYFDEVLADDTARPTINWPGAGTTLRRYSLTTLGVG